MPEILLREQSLEALLWCGTSR